MNCCIWREEGRRKIMRDDRETWAILAVSFGTTHPETRAKTIDVIEQTIQMAFPDQKLYRAWTSQMVIRRLINRDGYAVDTVEQAMERMLADGVTRVIVQPTHVMDGIENERMKQSVLLYAERFQQVKFGRPLLAEESDFVQAAAGVMREFSKLPADTALVFVGHGTVHAANAVYERLEQQLHRLGYPHVFVGTVEEGPDEKQWQKRIRACGYRHVILTPFLIVAGEHAKSDIAGDQPDSWKSRLQALGLEVSCLAKGLGEYEEIRRMFAEHAQKAMEE